MQKSSIGEDILIKERNCEGEMNKMLSLIPFYNTFSKIEGEDKIFVKVKGLPNISLNLLNHICNPYHGYIMDIIFYSRKFAEKKQVPFQLLLVLNKKHTNAKLMDNIEGSNNNNYF